MADEINKEQDEGPIKEQIRNTIKKLVNEKVFCLNDVDTLIDIFKSLGYQDKLLQRIGMVILKEFAEKPTNYVWSSTSTDFNYPTTTTNSPATSGYLRVDGSLGSYPTVPIDSVPPEIK